MLQQLPGNRRDLHKKGEIDLLCERIKHLKVSTTYRFNIEILSEFLV